MLYQIKKRDNLEKIEKLALLQNQVNNVRLQEKLGKQDFEEDLTKSLEPFSNTIKNTSGNISKTIMETSNKNNKANSDLNETALDLMNDKGMIAPYLGCSLVNLFKIENKSHSKLK